MTLRTGMWGCVVVALAACGTPDNGGVEISFGPANVPSTAPVTTDDGSTSVGDAVESSSTTDEPPNPTDDPTNDPLPTTDDPTGDETTSSDDGNDSSSSGGDAAIECLGLDQATCMVTFGCGWPVGDGIFDMTNGPCGWDPNACPSFDPPTCTTSPACIAAQDEQNQPLCTATSCALLDQLTCPTVVGCVWYADAQAGGFCFGNG